MPHWRFDNLFAIHVSSIFFSSVFPMHTSLDCRFIGCNEAPETISEAQRAFVLLAEQVLLRLGFILANWPPPFIILIPAVHRHPY